MISKRSSGDVLSLQLLKKKKKLRKKKECNWDKYPVMFTWRNIQQNHTRKGIISIKVTGHTEHHFADLSEQIWADVWKIWERVYLGISDG